MPAAGVGRRWALGGLWPGGRGRPQAQAAVSKLESSGGEKKGPMGSSGRAREGRRGRQRTLAVGGAAGDGIGW
jgi:hypothetical protein